MKTITKTASIIALTFLAVGAVLNILIVPNQLLFTGTAILLFLFIILPAFVRQCVNDRKGFLSALAAVWIALLILFVLVSLYMGVFGQGPVPLMIFCGMVIWMVLYLILRIRRSVEHKAALRSFTLVILGGMVLIFFNAPFKSDLPDHWHDPEIADPAYEPGGGPLVLFDEGHHNRNTLDSRYITFANVLRKDGYRLEASKSEFIPQALQKCDILVISNAIHEKNVRNWSNPVYSAFTKEEIATLQAWVNGGGSLFVIADHMPLGGAAKELSNAFGFDFANGHAGDTMHIPDVFIRGEGTLHDNVITNGRNKGEMVNSVETFSGQAFEVPEGATPVLTFGPGYVQWLPEKAWDLKSCVPQSIEGWAQGAYMEYGKGRLVMFGEAAMFTGQYGGGLSWVKMGLNSPGVDNEQLLLNIMHWLDRTI